MPHGRGRPGRAGRRHRLLTHCNTGLATAGSAPPSGSSTPRRRRGAGPVLASETRPLLQGPGSPPGSWSTPASRSPWSPTPPPAPPWPAAWSTPCWSAATGWPPTATPPTRSAHPGRAGRRQPHPLLRGRAAVVVRRGRRRRAAIEIEQRPAAEVSTLAGAQWPPAAGVWNPAFDVTPAALITAFVTDAGVLRPRSGLRSPCPG